MTRKLVVRDTHGERELLLIGTMAVGRDPRCDISDGDPRLSRRHGEFVATPDEVRVRNLGSRNGIQVNGASVNEAVLQPGDVVRMAHLTMRYIEEEPLPARTAEPAAERPGDKTLLVPSRSPAAARAHGGGPRPAAPPPLSLPTASDEDDDATRLVSPPTPAPAPVSSPDGLRRVRSREDAPALPGAGAAEQPNATARATRARAPRTSWTTRVTLRVVVLAVSVFALAALPLWMWHQRLASQYALSRSLALAQWLAADAAAADESGAIGEGADRVSREPGVVSALVVSRDGRVLAPPHRATESYGRVPALDLAVADVRGAGTTWNGAFIEAVVPVVSRRSGHVAIAWVTSRPSALPEARAGAVVILAPALLMALVGAFVVARGIRRATLRAVAALNQDIELALSGHVESVVDPLGARPMRDLTDTVNYLLARLRGAGGGPELSARPAKAAARPTAGRASGGHREARIVTDSGFRITQASPGCLDLLGLKPSALIGRHLLDAVAEGDAADAVFRCLADLGPGAETATSVANLGLDLSVARGAGDGPVTIVFRKLEPAVRV